MMTSLEHAEARFDAAMRDSTLTYDERFAAARNFFFRAYQYSEDAEAALRAWVLQQPLAAAVDEERRA